MKREEKNALSRQRILDAALLEFSQKGYDAASLNSLCAENDISKGIIYHYFKDKDDLFLLCVTDCYEKLTSYLSETANSTGNTEKRLRTYFDARLHFFAENPVYLGIFLNVTLSPPEHLSAELATAKEPFERLSIRSLTELLCDAPLRMGIKVQDVVEDFRMYIDYFNARFRMVLEQAESPQQAFQEHDERCHRQLNILLHGVLEKQQ